MDNNLTLLNILSDQLVDNLYEARRDQNGKVMRLTEGDYNDKVNRNQTRESLKSQIKMLRKLLMDISEQL